LLEIKREITAGLENGFDFVKMANEKFYKLCNYRRKLPTNKIS